MSLENDFVSCASILQSKILIITGGVSVFGNVLSGQTLIVDLEAKTSRKVGNLNVPRCSHGMKFFYFDDGLKLIVFGGQDEEYQMDTIKTFDFETESWKLSKVKLDLGRHNFGYIALPSSI